MKKILLAAIALCNIALVNAQLKTPAPSSTQTIKQEFGLSSIELSYSRPGVKGREIFGGLVPYDKVWRTGANGATTITFGDDVTIGGTKVVAGKYGLLSIPDKDEWTLIISKQLNVTSPTAYKQEEDVVRVPAKVYKIGDKVETFTIQFDNVAASSCELYLMWDKTIVVLPITTDVETKVMAQVDQQMNKDNRPYFSAAMYYMDNGKDLKKAAEWFDKAAELNPSAFWIHYNRAKCYTKLGKKTVAKEAAQTSLALATKAENGDYVKLNEDLLKELK